MLIGLTSLFESETDNILAVGEAINIILFFLIVNDKICEIRYALVNHIK